jgi:hypothetical protein
MNSRKNTRRQRFSPIARRLQARGSKPDRPERSQEHIQEHIQERLDESLEESFPASDAPSWTVLTKIGSPR